VPLGVTTWIGPVVAPAGTAAVIGQAETKVNSAVVPLNVTLGAPVKLVPGILTVDPTLADVVYGTTKGTKPTEKLKTEPLPAS
jgi:hypothetical protein